MIVLPLRGVPATIVALPDGDKSSERWCPQLFWASYGGREIVKSRVEIDVHLKMGWKFLTIIVSYRAVDIGIAVAHIS